MINGREGHKSMVEAVYIITLIGTTMVLAAAFSSLIAFRFGAPLLLLFLGIGLAAGEDGFGIPFDNAPVAYFIGSLCLAVILFDSGFGTPLASLRQSAMPAFSLASIGVLATAGIFGAAAHYLAGLDWLEAFLLGSIVASTDAAAVFFLLRAGGLNLRERPRTTLEIESGSNDPIAIFLTLALVELLQNGATPTPGTMALDILGGFLVQIGIGFVAGLAGGRILVFLVKQLKLDAGLRPIFAITLALIVFAAAGMAHGSGFLAVYVAGLVAGNSAMPAATSLKRVQDGFAWLAQIVMFLVLGLFATPHHLPSILPQGIALSLVLVFLARPAAVLLCLLPFRYPRAEIAFVSWVGLRGAVSILLALTPIIGRLENGRLLFDLAFIVVVVSLVLQGWTLAPVARWLRLVVPPRIGPVDKVELELPGSAHHELLSYRVAPDSPVARGGKLPRWARPSLVIRGGQSMKLQDAGALATDDLVYIFVSDRYPPLLDRLFASRVSLDPNDREFFGAFVIDPGQPTSELAANYAIELSETERELTIAELIASRVPGRPEFADRVSVGQVELIVRDLDDEGRIASVGLLLEPYRPTRTESPSSLFARRARAASQGLAKLKTRWRPTGRQGKTG